MDTNYETLPKEQRTCDLGAFAEVNVSTFSTSKEAKSPSSDPKFQSVAEFLKCCCQNSQLAT